MVLDHAFFQDYSRWMKFDWLPVHAAILAVGEFPTSAEEDCEPPIPPEKQERYSKPSFSSHGRG